MHSRIMGILTKENYNKLMEENNGVIEMPRFSEFDRLPGWADYVDDDVNFEDDFEWFCGFLNKDNDYFEYNPETHIILKNNISRTALINLRKYSAQKMDLKSFVLTALHTNLKVWLKMRRVSWLPTIMVTG